LRRLTDNKSGCHCNLADDAAVIPPRIAKEGEEEEQTKESKLLGIVFFLHFFLSIFRFILFHLLLPSPFRFRVESQERQPPGTIKEKGKKRVSRRFPDLASSQVRAACEFISCRRRHRCRCCCCRRRRMRTITNGTRAIHNKK